MLINLITSLLFIS